MYVTFRGVGKRVCPLSCPEDQELHPAHDSCSVTIHEGAPQAEPLVGI